MHARTIIRLVALVLSLLCVQYVFQAIRTTTNSGISSGGSGGSQPIPMATIQQAFSEAQAAVSSFHQRLLSKLKVSSDKKKNLVYSPLSVHLALDLTKEGASTHTLREMDAVLGLRLMPDSGTTQALALLSRSLGSGGTNSDPLSIANGVWISDQYSVSHWFLNRASELYAAGASYFSTPAQAVSSVNRFVDEKTRGKIPKLLDQLPQNARMVLVNALYFKSLWQNQFDVAKTYDANFGLFNGAHKTVPLMNRYDEEELYGEHEIDGLKFQSLTLKYQDSYSLTLVLPEEAGEKALSNLEQLLASKQGVMSLITEQQSKQELSRIAIPRFKAKWQGSLKQSLIDAGMTSAFTPSADFSKMSADGNHDLMIHDVIHSAVVEVDEKGTEAAAATAVIMVDNAMMGTRNPAFVANRPFLFALQHEPSSLPVFFGRIVNP